MSIDPFIFPDRTLAVLLQWPRTPERILPSGDELGVLATGALLVAITALLSLPSVCDGGCLTRASLVVESSCASIPVKTERTLGTYFSLVDCWVWVLYLRGCLWSASRFDGGKMDDITVVVAIVLPDTAQTVLEAGKSKL